METLNVLAQISTDTWVEGATDIILPPLTLVIVLAAIGAYMAGRLIAALTGLVVGIIMLGFIIVPEVVQDAGEWSGETMNSSAPADPDQGV